MRIGGFLLGCKIPDGRQAEYLIFSRASARIVARDFSNSDLCAWRECANVTVGGGAGVDGEKVTNWVEWAIAIGLVVVIERVVTLAWKKLRPAAS